MHYKVVLDDVDSDGWIVARVPELPGCLSQGRTEGEALANAREAISSHLVAPTLAHNGVTDNTTMTATTDPNVPHVSRLARPTTNP